MNSSVPVYEQIVQQVRKGVLSGALSAGDNLPAIRQLANDLGLNQNTVAKAYKLLEQQHVTVNRGRKGTCVDTLAVENIEGVNESAVVREMSVLWQSFRARGMDNDSIYTLVTATAKTLKTKI